MTTTMTTTMMLQSFVLLLVAVLVSLVSAFPSDGQPALRQEPQTGDDFMIPPPNSPESETKAKAFVAAYNDYVKSLGMYRR